VRTVHHDDRRAPDHLQPPRHPHPREPLPDDLDAEPRRGPCVACVPAGPADLARARDAEPTLADSPAFWLYTSGTTGTPKAAMHRHGSLRTTALTYGADVLAIRPDDVCYSAAKFFFAYGLGNTLTFPFSAGARRFSLPPHSCRAATSRSTT